MADGVPKTVAKATAIVLKESRFAHVTEMEPVKNAATSTWYAA